MGAKAWSRCGFCGQEILRSQYETAGLYLHIGNNGHFEPRWFCNATCLMEDLKNHLATHGKIKCIAKKPFGEKHRLKINITITTNTK